MSNVVASTIFCIRNTNKVEHGQIGRVPVAMGQAKNVFNTVKELDNSIGKTAQTASSIFNKASKGEKLLEYGGKFVNFASKAVNPLICVSAGIDVITAEDKDTALIKNSLALGSMFAVEKTMKKHMHKVTEIKGVDKIAEKVMSIAKTQKGQKNLATVIGGVAFVIGSCTAYSIGEKLGTVVASKVKGQES